MLKISFSQKKNILFLNITGQITIDTINDFETVIKHELLDYPPIVAIGCYDLTLVDSTGLNHLIKFAHTAQGHDAKIFFLDMKPAVMQMFNFADLGRISTYMTMDEFEADYLALSIA